MSGKTDLSKGLMIFKKIIRQRGCSCGRDILRPYRVLRGCRDGIHALRPTGLSDLIFNLHKSPAIAMLLLFITIIPVAAQRIVTDDEVNAIAKKLYCPVCENIPLDTCGTAACSDWRYEIRLQLEAGKTEQEIIDDFVLRFGDRVVGTPQDPLLRAISLITPIVAIIAALGIAAYVFLERRKPKIAPVQPGAPLDKYEMMLEEDLAG